MSEHTSTVIVLGTSPSNWSPTEEAVNFKFIASAGNIVEYLLTASPALIVLPHSPPRFEAITTAQTIRNLDLEVPILLVLPQQDPFTRISGYQNGVTWCIELDSNRNGAETWTDLLDNLQRYYATKEEDSFRG